ncbi:hypothetical protein CO661_18260 [Sinorhizobium fredii]|uniref:Uncharacterized protein n=1 Tax=Rhizobium fredii TaxID=380 RepID=A0A2A6LVE9_RHIFR|nr:hypothetical protein CO661_18260 [Sinorhizobium fredii]
MAGDGSLIEAAERALRSTDFGGPVTLSGEQQPCILRSAAGKYIVLCPYGEHAALSLDHEAFDHETLRLQLDRKRWLR